MKRYIILFTLMLLKLGSVYSQEINVLGFYLQPTDLTASTYPRKDLNNKECALIKVVITEPNVTFEGNVIGEVEFKTNEYWVYVSNGTKQLKVKVANALPLLINFKDHNIIDVKSKLTYELFLKNESNEASKPQMQKLTVKVNPHDSKVEIDGFDFPVLDGTIVTLLPVGSHNVSVVNNNNSKTEQITLFASSPKELVIDLNLKNADNRNSITNVGDLSEEEFIYNNAVKYIKEGNDMEAEKLALRAISKNYGSCYEILRTLLNLGYYDRDKSKYSEIKALIDQWEKTHATEYYMKKAESVAPKFGLR